MTQAIIFLWTKGSFWCTQGTMRPRLNASIRVPVTPELKETLERVALERGELPATMARRVLKEYAGRQAKRGKERVA